MKKISKIFLLTLLIVMTSPLKKCGEQAITKAIAAPEIIQWEFGDPTPCEPPPRLINI